MRIFYILFFIPSFFALSQAKLTITDAIRMGKSNNPYSKLYKLNAEIEKAELITSGLRPNILLNQQSLFLTKQSSLNAIQPNQTIFISPYGNQLWFQATKQFQINGKRQNKIEYQKQKLAFAESDIAQFTSDIAYNTALRWVEVWYAKVKLEILEDAKRNVDTLLAINKIRLRNQVITATELARNQMISDQYKTQLNAGQQVYKSEMQKLAFATGNAEIKDIDREADFFFTDVSDNLDILIDSGLVNRPDLKADIANSKISQSNIRLQKSLSTPNPEFGFILNPQNTQPYIGWYFQMPLPIFDKNQGGIQKSKIQYSQNLAQVDVTKLQIKSEISYTLQEYETYRDNSESYRQIVEDADNILKTVRFSYLRGGTTIVDYLLAQQNWFEIKKAYYETLYLYRKSYLNVLYTTGGLASQN